MTVTELLRRISSRELSEWMAYFEIEPFGPVRSDLQAAIVASTIANIFRGKRRRPFSPADFLPEFSPQAEEVDAAWEWSETDIPEEVEDRANWQRMLATVEQWNIALGGRDLRHGHANDANGQAGTE